MRVSFIATTPALTCEPTDRVRSVAALMASRSVGSVVVTRAGIVAGIVTDRDLVVRGVASGLSGDVAVERVMSHVVVTVPIDADVSDATDLMERHGVRRVPVVDADGHVDGIITLDDIARHTGHRLGGQRGVLDPASQADR